MWIKKYVEMNDGKQIGRNSIRRKSSVHIVAQGSINFGHHEDIKL